MAFWFAFGCVFVYWFSVSQTCGNIVPCWWGTGKSGEQNYAQAIPGSCPPDRPPARQEIRSIFGKISLIFDKNRPYFLTGNAGNQKATADCLERTSVRWAEAAFAPPAKGLLKTICQPIIFAWRRVWFIGSVGVAPLEGAIRLLWFVSTSLSSWCCPKFCQRFCHQLPRPFAAKMSLTPLLSTCAMYT